MATMETLTLQEYQECTVDFPLDKEQLAALASSHIGVTPSPEQGEDLGLSIRRLILARCVLVVCPSWYGLRFLWTG